METRSILLISSVLFTCGCLGLLTVRFTNPFFKSMGWLGGAFASGALAAITYTVRPDVSLGRSVILPDILVLLAYVFLHTGILELTESKSPVPKLGIYLLGTQAACYPIFLYFRHPEQLCVIALGFLLAVQATQSAIVLKKSVNSGMKAPMWFSIVLLSGFAGYNLFRSGVVFALGVPQSPQTPNPLELTSAFVFLGTGLGLGFSMFWMASMQIRTVLESQANTDPLTGVYNRRSFVLLAQQELMRSERSGEMFSLIMFDLDHFKKINDRYGHSAGDAVLCAVVEKLRNAVRNIDMVGRWGGEEFVALLPKADARAAMVVAQRLRHSVESLSVASPYVRKISGENQISVTVSIGVSTYFGQIDTIDDLLHQCDTAMYQAKESGRNRIAVFDAPASSPSTTPSVARVAQVG